MKFNRRQNGDEAFPAMLDAMNPRKNHFTLHHIFRQRCQRKKICRRTRTRGQTRVEVRVLVDAAGRATRGRPITYKLRHAKIPFAKFCRIAADTVARGNINLRNHRKALVIDGKIAFTGGINIRHGNVLADKPKSPVRDLQFRIVGPRRAIAGSLASDWFFCAKEILEGELWFPPLPKVETSSPAPSPMDRTPTTTNYG